MTDQRLRDLERDAAHGDLQARTRLLLERVRVGDLTEERLRLAAYLDDEAAKIAVGVEPGLPSDDVNTWLAELETRGHRRRALEAMAAAAGFELPHRISVASDELVGTWLVRQATGASFERSGNALRTGGSDVLQTAFRLLTEGYSSCGSDDEAPAGRVKALRAEMQRRLTAWALAPRGSST